MPGTLRTCDRSASRFPHRIQSQVPSTPGLCLIHDETQATPACPPRALRETQTTRATRKTPICSDSYEAGAAPVSPASPSPQARAAPVAPPPPTPQAGAAPVAPPPPSPQARAAPVAPPPSVAAGTGCPTITSRSSPAGQRAPAFQCDQRHRQQLTCQHDRLTARGRFVIASTRPHRPDHDFAACERLP